MKETFYFPHDYNPRSDDKIKPLLRKFGMTGYGIFWAIIEDLYNNANALRTDYESIAFDLRVDIDMVKSIINDFDLFQIEGDLFGSLSVQRRLEERNNKSSKARESAFKRWNKDANAMPTQCERIDNLCEGNAIKEKKVKEIKIKESKSFITPSILDIETYCSERKNKVNAQRFFDFYQSNGWMVGKNKMKDWKASIRTWEQNDYQTTQKSYMPNIF